MRKYSKEEFAMDMTEYKDIVVYIETADKSPVKVGLEMLSPARKIAG